MKFMRAVIFQVALPDDEPVKDGTDGTEDGVEEAAGWRTILKKESTHIEPSIRSTWAIRSTSLQKCWSFLTPSGAKQYDVSGYARSMQPGRAALMSR